MAPRTLLPPGTTFHRLTVIGIGDPHIESNGYPRYRNRLRCECGTILDVAPKDLRSGNTKSCGCLKIDLITDNKYSLRHGQNGTKTYSAWHSMKARCLNPNNKMFPYYGGRGISVCNRWLDGFENFLSDMGESPEGLSLDRIDVNGNYEPGNCRWTDAETQGRNKRNTIFVTLNGEELPITVASRRLGLTPTAVRLRCERQNITPQTAIDDYAANGKSPRGRRAGRRPYKHLVG